MSKGKPSDRLPRLTVRFSKDVRAWLRQEAEHNMSTEASEVVRAVRERMGRQAGAPLAAMVEG